MTRRWSTANVLAAIGVFLGATAAGMAGPKALRQVFDVTAPTVADAYFSRMPWAYPIAIAALGFGLGVTAGIIQGVQAEHWRQVSDDFAAQHGWSHADAPTWVHESATPPLAPSARPKASHIWEGEYRGWTAWSLEIEARFGWRGAKAPATYYVVGMSVASSAQRIELARKGSVYARAYRGGDMHAASTLHSVGWVALHADESSTAGLRESWALASVLGTVVGVGQVVVDGGAIWASVGADQGRQTSVQAALDSLVAVAHVMTLQPSRR